MFSELDSKTWSYLGNEMADTLANIGASTPFAGIEPFCRVGNDFFIEFIMKQLITINEWIKAGLGDLKDLLIEDVLKLKHLIYFSFALMATWLSDMIEMFCLR